MHRAWVWAVGLVAVTGCAHTETMVVDTDWRAAPQTQFFLAGEAPADMVVPPGLIAAVLASIRGGLGELGHVARTGFATLDKARAAAARCADACVVVQVRLMGLSGGGSFVERKLLTGAGDMHVALEATFFDREGNTLANGSLMALPYEGGSSAQIAKHVVPTIGPAFAEAISEAP